MRHPPDLPDGTVVTAVRGGFGAETATLVPLPVGNDADSWSYRVETAAGPAWFLKVRAGPSPGRGAAVPALLQRRGVPNVLAPLATSTGASSVTVGRFALALYPLLEARPGAEAGLSPAQWRELGATMRQVHAVPATPELIRLVGREAFRGSRAPAPPTRRARHRAPGRSTRAGTCPRTGSGAVPPAPPPGRPPRPSTPGAASRARAAARARSSA